MSYRERIRRELAALGEAGLRRTVRERAPSGGADFSSNDYLGLAGDAEVVDAARGAVRVGSGGSRLLAGAYGDLRALERELAAYAGREAALVFSSGYLAALGGIGTLSRVTSLAFSDERNHAALIDGLRLTKLERRVLPHRTLPPPHERSSLAVTESLFGMDGDAADLGALLEALGPDDVLFVDEAHAFGVAGPGGAGLARALGDDRVVVLGTLSKALGAAGGFIAGPAETIAFAQNVARGFVFDTAPALPVVAAARAALRIARDDASRRARLHRNVALVRSALADAGVAVPPALHPESPIVPVIAGSAHAALALAGELAAHGLYAPAIRPPTVPDGTARLRITVRADHTEADVARLAGALRAAHAALGAAR